MKLLKDLAVLLLDVLAAVRSKDERRERPTFGLMVIVYALIVVAAGFIITGAFVLADHRRSLGLPR